MIRVALVTMSVYAFVTGTNSTLFLQEQGASAAQVGLLGAVMGVGPLAQLVGLRLLQRLGKVRTLSLGRVGLAIALGLLAGLALLGLSGPRAIYASMGILALVSVCMHVGETAWWPLLQDVTAGEPKGPFFSRMRSRLRVMEVLLPIAAGLYLGKDPSTRMFAAPFLAAGLGAVVASVFIRRASERPVITRRVPLLVGLWRAAHITSVRRYGAFVWLYHLALMALSGRFWVVMLKDLGLPSGHIVWLTAVAAIGHVAGLKLWAWMVDHHGGRSTLSLTTVGAALMGFWWLMLPWLPAGVWALMTWAVLFHLLWGFFAGGSLMGRTQVMMEAVPESVQADAFTLVNLIAAVGGAAGSLLHGWAFELLQGSAWGGLDGRLAYLAAVQVGSMVMWRSKVRLVGHDQQTPARRLVWTTLRWWSSRLRNRLADLWMRRGG